LDLALAAGGTQESSIHRKHAAVKLASAVTGTQQKGIIPASSEETASVIPLAARLDPFEHRGG
jgi:hypothetical protein